MNIEVEVKATNTDETRTATISERVSSVSSAYRMLAKLKEQVMASLGSLVFEVTFQIFNYDSGRIEVEGTIYNHQFRKED